MTDRQSLLALMKRYDLRASKALGQNFLYDAGIIQDIAEASGAEGQSGVIELGPGPGLLTSALAECAAKVLALEVDGRVIPALEHTLEGCGNVNVLRMDARKADFPALIEEHFKGLRPLFCSNLPYNLTSPLLTAALAPGCFERVTVMVQREVAERLAAEAGTPEYGAFTLYVRNRADVNIVFDVPPAAFVPPPKVHSSVVTLERVKLRCEHPLFERVVRAAFAQRRKQLINALSAGLSITRERAASALESCGIDVRARGETLELEDFAQLAAALAK